MATVHEASGRRGLVDVPLIQIVRGSRAAGPARTVRCGQGDNLMVHAVDGARGARRRARADACRSPPRWPCSGDLLATQAKARGVAAVLVDAAIRDLEELSEPGLPIWARYVRVRGADKAKRGAIDEPVEMGGATIRPGDVVVLDADGAVVVERARRRGARGGSCASGEASV